MKYRILKSFVLEKQSPRKAQPQKNQLTKNQNKTKKIYQSKPNQQTKNATKQDNKKRKVFGKFSEQIGSNTQWIETGQPNFPSAMPKRLLAGTYLPHVASFT